MNRLSLIIIYLVYATRAFQLSLPETFQILRAFVSCPTGQRMAVVGTLTHCQMVAAWVWFHLVIRMYHSIDNIGFMQLLKQLRPKCHNEMLY